MGIWDIFSDLAEAAAPWSVAQAEAPPAEESKDAASKDDDAEADESEKKEDGDDKEDGAEEKEDEDDEEGGDEEEDDEEELKDPKEIFEEECKNSKQCAPAKHHFDHCVERVTEQGSKEDCVEEFFHLTHCATQCAAPKLWAALK